MPRAIRIGTVLLGGGRYDGLGVIGGRQRRPQDSFGLDRIASRLKEKALFLWLLEKLIFAQLNGA